MVLLILSLCSTFRNGSHIGWSTGTSYRSETNLKLDTLRMIVAKFGSYWFIGFREDFLKVYSWTTDARWWKEYTWRLIHDYDHIAIRNRNMKSGNAKRWLLRNKVINFWKEFLWSPDHLKWIEFRRSWERGSIFAL
jgi:hypothetical protein